MLTYCTCDWQCTCHRPYWQNLNAFKRQYNKKSLVSWGRNNLQTQHQPIIPLKAVFQTCSRTVANLHIQQMLYRQQKRPFEVMFLAICRMLSIVSPPPISPCLSLHQLLRDIFGSLTAKRSTMFTASRCLCSVCCLLLRTELQGESWGRVN